ncbi:hypothetical protein LEP1GSC188_0084 [Leptospira weilii serovar Topaz str. LT2116]|uniref:Uncharacterized protein n=1 Tax=Leptospira weilii serovar Topaz str. LT2116 TaxID=1088540 RepID=M3H5T9_9LEPT|nr:hypothetical protein LEP1GSC188_0084 [Leptospira weilii serovar Topaz str. LT2116]
MFECFKSVIKKKTSFSICTKHFQSDLERVPKPSDFNKISTDCCSCSYVLGQILNFGT